MPTFLHHVAIMTDDWDRSVRFYCDVLGFSVAMLWEGETPSGTIHSGYLDSGNGSCVELFETTADRDPSPRASARPGDMVHIAVATDDLEGTFVAARDFGAVVDMEPTTVTLSTVTGQGEVPVLICFFRGPSGEMIELVQGVPAFSS